MQCPLTTTETVSDVKFEGTLTKDQQTAAESLLARFTDVMTERPGRTTLVEFSLKLMDDKPIHCKPYPLPHEKLEVVRNELKAMVALGVIEPAQSPYSSPVVLVKKKDQSHRFCIDFRKLNRITECESKLYLIRNISSPRSLAQSIFRNWTCPKVISKYLLRRRTVRNWLSPQPKARTIG